MSQVIIISFGYLHDDPPQGAHITLDLRRHFRDPHVDPALKHLTANDPQVRDAVLGTPGIVPLIKATAAAARAYMSGPAADSSGLAIAVGCAGGRHRAATVAAELRDLLFLDGYDVTLIHRDIDKGIVERGHTVPANPHPRRCLYQCADHHGAGPKVHTLDCVLPSPMAEDAHVCDNCRAEITRQEIAADPYYRGDNYAMFGDDE